MKAIISTSLISLFLLVAGITACRNRPDNSNVSATYTSAPQPTSGDIGAYLNTDFPTDSVEFTLTSQEDSLANFAFSVAESIAPIGVGGTSPPPKLKTPPEVTITDAAAAAGASPVVKGSMFFIKGSSLYTANANLLVKKGSTYKIVIDQHGQITKSGRGSVSSAYNPVNVPTNGWALGPKDLEAAFYYDGKPVQIQLSPSRRGPVSVEVSCILSRPSATLFNTDRDSSSKEQLPKMTVTLQQPNIPNGKTTTSHDFSTPTELSASLPYALTGAISLLTLDFGPEAKDALISLSVYLSEMVDRSGNKMVLPMGPFGAPPGIAIGFNQSTDKQGMYGDGKTPIRVYANQSPPQLQEGKLELGATVTRFVNKNSKKLPRSVKVNLVDSAGKTLGESNFKTTSTHHWNSIYNASIIADFPSGENQALFESSAFEPDDIITLSAVASTSNLTVPPGGDAMLAKLDDHGITLPTMPPIIYSADKDVKTQPYTPKITPINLAQKTILNAMNLTRLTLHQRIPKENTRGASNLVDPGTIEACLANAAPHWSDIILHYYCQHGQSRACYTYKAPTMGRVPAYQACVTEDSWDFIMGRMKDEKGNDIPGQSDVFQYVMFSQTYAFDMQQQQDVINAFYHINNPSSAEECNEKRPRRGIDPTDGTHCLATKTFITPLSARGN